jgi:hypothetical protein
MENIMIKKHHYMYFNVILSFDSINEDGESQEFFEMKLPLKKDEGHSAKFLMNKFFPKVVTKCTSFNRRVGDLIKISTASDWDLFEKVTGLDSLCTLGHSCKWYFGKGRNDLDEWEIMLTKIYGFGTEADLLDMNEYIERIKKQMEEQV